MKKKCFVIKLFIAIDETKLVKTAITMQFIIVLNPVLLNYEQNELWFTIGVFKRTRKHSV